METCPAQKAPVANDTEIQVNLIHEEETNANILGWNDDSLVEVFFEIILRPLAFDDNNIKEVVDTAKRLRAFNVRALRLSEKKYEDIFGLIVGNALIQHLQTSKLHISYVLGYIMFTII